MGTLYEMNLDYLVLQICMESEAAALQHRRREEEERGRGSREQHPPPSHQHRDQVATFQKLFY